MKKSKLNVAFIISIVLILAILLIPIPMAYDDGGTLRLTSLTYTVMFWKRLELVYEENGDAHAETREDFSFHFFPNHFKDYDELWAIHTERNS